MEENVLKFLKPFRMVSMAPVLTVNIGGHILNFILDTGSGMSLIDKNVAESLGLVENIEAANIKLTGIGNENSKINEKANLSFAMDDMTFEGIFLLCDCAKAFCSFKKFDKIDIFGLLGSDFLSKYKFVLDYEKSAIYIFNSDIYPDRKNAENNNE